MGSNQIVVGLEGAAPSWHALRWAVDEALRWHSSLRVVTVDHAHRSATEPTGESHLARIMSEAHRLQPSVRITGTVGFGEVVPTLREAAGESWMIVVGRRGHGGLGRLLAGSTSLRIANEAPVPVTVVPDRSAERGPIVVGVDGSAGSDGALGVALDEARTRRCAVTAVLAYSQPVHPWLTDGRPPPTDPQLLHACAYAALDNAVEPWRDKFPEIAVTATVVARPAASTLASLSGTAQLVVVGAHGRDRATGPLGSVPERLLHHARCPVLIARA